MSDTPETDATANPLWGDAQELCLLRDLCRKLERERDEARAELNEWQTLRLWGAEPHNIHEFIHGQQARIHETQDIERERDEAQQQFFAAKEALNAIHVEVGGWIAAIIKEGK